MMNDVIQIFNEDSGTEDVVSTGFTMESVRSMVKQMNEIDDQIKDLRESKKEMVQDFVDEYNIPKKEVSVAIRMLKTDVDPETTVDIYSNIADLVE
jgi:hypoxanthine phosphoribosyltransferase